MEREVTSYYYRRYYDVSFKDCSSRFNVFSIFIFCVIVTIYRSILVYILPLPEEKLTLTLGLIGIVVLIRTAFVIVSTIHMIVHSYSENKMLPITRLSYKEIKELSKVFPDKFRIGRLEVEDAYSTYKRLVIIYEDKDICGDLFTYLVLGTANYVTNLTERLGKLLSKVGIVYFTNKKAKQEFNAKINEETVAVLKSLSKHAEHLQKEQLECFKQISYK